jgi:microcystin-dependent protein
MGEAYLGEIFMGGWNFAPRGFAFCSGQLLPISQNTALFSLLGTNFGGDGVQTFALPDLRGRTPVHWGQGPGLSNYNIGEATGTEVVTLSQAQIPAHNHLLNANAAGANAVSPVSAFLAVPVTGSGPNASPLNIFTTNTTPLGSLNPATISNTGGNQPHSNIQPSLSITFVIALTGIYPARN